MVPLTSLCGKFYPPLADRGIFKAAAILYLHRIYFPLSCNMSSAASKMEADKAMLEKIGVNMEHNVRTKEVGVILVNILLVL